MTDATNDPRAQRGLAIVQGSKKIRQVLDGKYLVPTQTGTTGTYFVDVAEETCTCPDFETTRLRCKHIWAVLFARKDVAVPGGNAVTEKKPSYPQNWGPYRQARMHEKECFEPLLAALCRGIVQPAYPGDGRPPLPLADVIFAGALKVFTTFSGERAHSDVVSAKERGLTDVAPHPNTVFKILRKPETIPILRQLIEESARPLRLLETEFAADATGIGAKGYVRWFDEKWGKDRREKRWLKLHMMIGVKTQIITGVEVTHGSMNDSPMLPALLDQTAGTFKMKEVSADMGYLSRENFSAITKTGAEPFIPFKINSKASGRDDLWDRLFAFYTFNRPKFLQHYHKRSLTEAHFSAIKRVLGPSVRAKSETGQFSEVYLKVLCSNIRVLVQSMYELGVEATFWKEAS